MTNSRTFTDRDLTRQVLDYLDAGVGREDFNATGIVRAIQQQYGTVDIDTIDPAAFVEIVQANDISAVSFSPDAYRTPRQAFIRDLYSLAAFYTSHPSLPVPKRLNVQHDVGSRAEIASIAAELAERVHGAGDVVHHNVPGTRAFLWFITDEDDTK